MLRKSILFYILVAFHIGIAASNAPAVQEQIPQKYNDNLNVNLRILNKLTGKTQDIVLSEKQDTIEISSLKIKYKSAFTEKVTPSTRVLWVFLEIWHKDTEYTEDEWTLHYSNWLCNLDNRFENKEWGIYILDIK
ncbi:MAG TPA: hypothetical protein DIC42_05500 [Holosporales bacterium]|nr:hypothetical protein [Holosporales bacterium]